MNSTRKKVNLQTEKVNLQEHFCDFKPGNRAKKSGKSANRVIYICYRWFFIERVIEKYYRGVL